MSFKNKVEVKQFEFSPSVNTPITIVDMISTDFTNPTFVAKITFDCLKPGDRIWLNSIFHLTNNTTFEPIIDYRILKNNVPIPIYMAETEIDSNNEDNIGQIFSQETVDVIKTLEKNVTYQVVVSASADFDIPNVSLLGPITFTGTRYADEKNDLPLNKVEIKQFEFDTPENSPGMGTKISEDFNKPTVVGKITFDCLKPGDRIWLNSIFHLTNFQPGETEPMIDHRILKNNVPFYTAKTELDTSGDDNIGQIFLQETVDVIKTLEKNVTYQVVVSTSDMMNTNVILLGPITFTGTQFSDGKNGLSLNKVEVKQFEFVTPEKTPITIVDMISTDSINPTFVAKITFDCLKPGDRIWLNSIFHLTNNTTFEPIIDYRILKNNVPIPIYMAETELDTFSDDNIGQIFSQETVDVIKTLEKNVTYQVVVSAPPDANVPLLGPITLTGTRFVKGKRGFG
ncbi:hypothetical protein [Chengkuizengella sediminis]|uniref:hypothetical protein n=1 Tax=Chengkuizengella sediminis TaxID=1885917 RepID=UPI001389BDF6|nr:hypothetical protein [Chengkuizengella sediminis]NDI35499.1 hypothetical protein [Chengkuizengella sediminis]